MAFKKQSEEKIIDVDASMHGTLNFKDSVNLRINGKFEGNLNTKGVLMIGPNANVIADIAGDSIIVEGKVRGKVIARVCLELLPNAVIDGEIFPAKLIISNGGILNGKCQMLGEIFSVDELARYLEVEINSILEWVNQGKIPAVKQGDGWKFERKAIDFWVASGKINPERNCCATDNTSPGFLTGQGHD